MEIEYCRSASISYMVILEVNRLLEDYEVEMLRNNNLPQYLPFHCIVEDGKMQLWYEITGKKAMATMRQIGALDGEMFQRLLRSLDDAQQELMPYLLDENHIFLTFDTIYIDGEGKFLFTYLPDCQTTLREQLEILCEQFMEAMDYEKAQEVDLVYRFYEEVRDENFVLHQTYLAIEGWKRWWEEEQVAQQERKQDIKEKVREERKREEENDRLQEQSERLEKKVKEESGLIQRIANISCIGEKIEQEAINRSIETYIQRQKGKIRQGIKRWTSFKPERKEANTPVVIHPDEGEKVEYPTLYLGDEQEDFEGELVYEGEGEENNIRVLEDKIIIGKRRGAAWGTITEESVSRVHALIQRKGKEYYIEDMNSANGTYVNGNRLVYRQQVKLEKNDQVRFAKLRYRFY